MRIIGGDFKGRILEASLNTKEVRPTTSQLREALFNICREQVKNSLFLDLFAGSGAIGIEALSRGARKIYFVERLHKCVSCIEKNLLKLKVSREKFSIYEGDAVSQLKKLEKKDAGIVFDIVYIDPPYDLFEDKKKIFLIFDLLKNFVKKETFVFLEHPKTFLFENIKNLSDGSSGSNIEMSGNVKGYRLEDSRRFGISHLSRYRKIL